MKIRGVEYGEGTAEVVSVKVEDCSGEKLTIITTYVPPKTNTWTNEEYDKMIEDTLKDLNRIIRKSKIVLLVGDFNCKEINWESFEAGGNQSEWGERFLNLTMENMMTQWVTESTRYRGDDEPTRLDLVLTKGMDLTQEIRYICPLGKSDHVLLEIETETRDREEDESYKANRRNYGKTDIEGLRKYYDEMD